MDEIIIFTKIPFVAMKAQFPKHGLSLFTDYNLLHVSNF